MDLKPIIFFLVVFFALLYLGVFWNNRHEKANFHFFGRKIPMNLGLLGFSIFLDGVIIGLLLFWLFA